MSLRSRKFPANHSWHFSIRRVSRDSKEKGDYRGVEPIFKEKEMSPGSVAQVVEAPSGTPKYCGFEPGSGHKPGMWVQGV